MTVSPPSAPILGMYQTGGAFPTPGASAWPSGPTTNLSATYLAFDGDWATYAAPFVAKCNANGLVPFVELEPWHWNKSAVPFTDITGGVWDTYLTGIGTAIAATGKPVILTFAHEMNVSGQYPWSQGDTGSGPGGGALSAANWQLGWKYVHDKVNSTAGGYALWMWACSAWTGGTTIDPSPWWPGSSYVDMVGIDGYPNTQYGSSLGTFAGQIQPTVTAIRALGWTGDIYLSETNLAQMVASGGQSITAFVASMHTAGISGILEFEDAAWALPQMSGAQWNEYNTAIVTYYGSGGSTPPPSGGTFAAVGSFIPTNTLSFTWQPAAIGNVLVVIAHSETAGKPVTALSSSNATWTQVVADQTLGSGTVTEATAFIGTATSTARDTVALTTAAASGSVRVAGREFSAGGAVVQLDTFAKGGPVTAWPSVTPTRGGSELLVGFEFNYGTASAGSTAGVSYYTDPNGNGAADDTSVSAATTVGWADGTSRNVLVLLLYAGSGGGGGSPSGLLMTGIA